MADDETVQPQNQEIDLGDGDVPEDEGEVSVGGHSVESPADAAEVVVEATPHDDINRDVDDRRPSTNESSDDDAMNNSNDTDDDDDALDGEDADKPYDENSEGTRSPPPSPDDGIEQVPQTTPIYSTVFRFDKPLSQSQAKSTLLRPRHSRPALQDSYDDDDDFQSHSQDEQSAGSSDDDFTDADAAIDRMLDDLKDFTQELDSGPYYSEEVVAASPEKTDLVSMEQSLDRLRFSMGSISDSEDVDLDALLEDLCNMEKDFNEDPSTPDFPTPPPDLLLSPRSAGSPKTPRSPKGVSPAKVTSDVKSRLHNLQEEVKELTPEEQEARIKAEKIKIALEKMKEASTQKLVVRVYEEGVKTSKTMLMDGKWTAREVIEKMIVKDNLEVGPNWCVVESLPDMHLERIIEDHEFILTILSNWTRDTDNKLVFCSRRDKYTLFRNPQFFLLSNTTSSGAAQLAEKNKDVLLKEFFTPDNTRVPDVESILWLKEGKRSWSKHYFVLRSSGVYYTPKGKTKSSRDLVCLVKFEHADIYYVVNPRKKFKAPAEHVFALKHPKVQTSKSKHVYCLCAEDSKTMQQWMIAIRMAKYGYKMYADHVATQENLEKTLLQTAKPQPPPSARSTEELDDEFSRLTGELDGTGAVRSDPVYKRKAEAEKRQQEQEDRAASSGPSKGKVSKRIGELFSDAWRKGTEEGSGPTITIKSPETPRTPDTATLQTPNSSFPRTFSISKSAGQMEVCLEEQPKTMVLDPVPTGKNSLKRGMEVNINDFDFPAPPPPPRRTSSLSEG